MNISRAWAMPNKNTFDIPPINDLIFKHKAGSNSVFLSVDPFANKNRIADVCNDIDPQYGCDYQMDALDFLKKLGTGSVAFLLFDPPYSPRQVSECYKNLGKTVNMQTTQSSFWGNLKKEISRVVDDHGVVMSFGWNSGGIGKSNGFEIVEVLIVAHGGWHNDTIVTVDQKIRTLI
jgi:hypothetical protein